LLINSTLYPILEFIFIKTGFTNYASSKTTKAIVFDQFSVQYLSLILFIPLAIPLFIRNISKLIKLAEFGVVAIVSFGVFVLYIFLRNVLDGTVSKYIGDMVYFTTNISEPAGQFALAFMVHNTIGALMKPNKIKANNERDLGVAYVNASLIYGLIGTFGAFGLLVHHYPSTVG
jgi:sodium-coupled neutral amino acid transporter 9